MIYITGDTHGDWISRLNENSFPEQKTMTKNDFVIILGDFGVWDNSKREKCNLDWLEQRSFTTLFISGNHDNYDILDHLETKTWHGGKVNYIRHSVLHLNRGEIYNIEGKSFFCFGGASSHDIKDGVLEPGDKRIKEWECNRFKLFRINHISWWSRELPSEDEMTNGLENLKRRNHKIDYILTHSPNTSILRQMDGGSGFYKPDYLTNYLQQIEQLVEFKQWFFGHMHINKNYYWNRMSCLYEQIIRIV